MSIQDLNVTNSGYKTSLWLTVIIDSIPDSMQE